jgi:hypothetical protein
MECNAMQHNAWKGKVRQGQASKVRQGKAWKGMERQGKARHGKAR